MKFAALLILALTAALPAQAQTRDSYYYMLDDGVQSSEEMLEEAQGIYYTCESNIFQKQYFDCRCMAGAFLQQREKLGGIAPQEEIINNLTIGNNIQCANTVGIAASAYSQCMESSTVFREYNKDNEEYCACVGNTAAKKFEAQPYMNTDYITDIHADALVKCNQRDDKGKPLPAQD